jgi:hypothetical protein
MKNAFLLAALLCAAFLFSTVSAANITFTFDSNYVDTGSDGEATNMFNFLTETLGHTVFKITSHGNHTQWTTALAKSSVVIFAESTNGINDNTKDEIKTWVKAGNIAIITTADISISSWMTELFSSGEELRKRGGGATVYPVTAAGRWLGGPEQVNEIDATSTMSVVDAVPSGLQTLYGTDESCVAWRYRMESGVAFMVGPDFYNFGPFKAQDGGWEVVVANMIKNQWSSPSSAAALGSWLHSLLALLQ